MIIIVWPAYRLLAPFIIHSLIAYQFLSTTIAADVYQILQAFNCARGHISPCVLSFWRKNIVSPLLFKNLPIHSFQTASLPQRPQKVTFNKITSYQQGRKNYIIIYWIYWMESKELRTILSELNLQLDLPLLLQIEQSVRASGAPKEISTARLHIIAAAAIKSEMRRLPAVGAKILVKTGPSLEIFLNHMPPNEKLPFLHSLSQLAQSDPAYSSLSFKVEEITRTYCIFIRFRSLFEQLGEKAGVRREIGEVLLNILWMVKLRIKGRQPSEPSDWELQLLLALLQYYFERMIRGHDLGAEMISNAFCKEFNESVSISRGKKYKLWRTFERVLKQVYDLRSAGSPDWPEEIEKEHGLIRMADDFSRICQDQFTLESQLINQLAYLQINHSLPPLPFSKTAPTLNAISLFPTFFGPPSLQHDDESNGDSEVDQLGDKVQSMCKLDCTSKVDGTGKVEGKVEEKQQTPSVEEDPEDGHIEYQIFRSFFVDEEDEGEGKKRRKKFIMESNESRVGVLKWIQNQTKLGGSVKLELEGVDLSTYERSNIGRLTHILEMSCSCKDKAHRVEMMFRFFLSVLDKVKRALSPEEQRLVLSNTEHLDAFLCLSLILFNHSYKATPLSFTQMAQLFGLSLVRAFAPINWLGLKAHLHPELSMFLYELEERILFEEVWKQPEAAEMIFGGEQQEYVQMAMVKRTLRHIGHRVRQVCQESEKSIPNVCKLVEEIVMKRRQILREANIFVIIACCVLYYSGKGASLPKILQILKKQDRIVAVNLEARDPQGKPITISNFYESAFLPEMEGMGMSSRAQFGYITPKKTPPTQVRPPSTLHKQTIYFGYDTINYRTMLAKKIHNHPQSPSLSQDEAEEDPQP